jgi:cytoskeletal protein CcmA (bactofilin family)
VTTIGATISISGEVSSSDDMTIEGRVDGHLIVRDGVLTIGERAQLHADIRGTRVLVKGHLNGSIVASERIELTASATVEGSLSANLVVIADGSTFNGGIDMDQRTIAARLAQFKAAQDPVE